MPIYSKFAVNYDKPPNPDGSFQLGAYVKTIEELNDEKS